ncbi:MAG: hypothetical protein DBY13_02290 [Lachnospiraceae bacterium]|jgi:membrane protein|nr:MAG: hypothetical protein DBY13_02290 [Lachnospiraceae bacterium]
MQTNRFYFLPSFIAAMLLLPSASKLMNTGIFFLLFPVAILLLGVVEKRDLIKNFQRRDLLIYVTVFLLSVIGLILKLSGVLQDQQYEYGEFLVVISMVLLCFALKNQVVWERWYFDIMLYAGGLILVLYFVNTAIAHDMIPLWGSGTSDIYYINMVAFLVMLVAAGQYIYCKDKIMQVIYIVSVILATLTMAVNAAWGTAFLTFVMLMVYSVAIVPVAAIMRKLLQMIFGIAFLFCNMSLLVNYTEIIQVDGLTYHLESSVVGELILCLLALYVFKQWDKIPEGTELTKVRLSRLQSACFYLLKYGGFVLIILAVLSQVNDKLGDSNIVQLFAGDKWEQLSTDVFAVTFLSLLENINQALIQAWHGNILAVMHQMYGVVGVIIITDVLAVACYKLYLTIRDRRIKDSLLTWLAIGVLAAVICLPIKVEALPVYMMILLLALYTAKPENGEPQVIETPRTEEREEELVEKEEMLEGVFII